MLYGTEVDRNLLLQWQEDRAYFSEICLCENQKSFLQALHDPTIEVYICMMDGGTGFQAVIAAHAHCPEKPMLWFPKSNQFTLNTHRYDCVACGTQAQMNAINLTWIMDRCRMKLQRASC